MKTQPELYVPLRRINPWVDVDINEVEKAVRKSRLSLTELSCRIGHSCSYLSSIISKKQSVMSANALDQLNAILMEENIEPIEFSVPEFYDSPENMVGTTIDYLARIRPRGEKEMKKDDKEYTWIFDKNNKNFDPKSHEKNVWFLVATENMFNDILTDRKVVFLNEILNHLGFVPVQCGQLMGWTFNPDHPGDHHISFGSEVTIKSPKTGRLLKKARPIKLTFNVEGDVLKFLPKE